jgi:3-oxoacyl-[acyl-carrier protein] reductase
MNLKGATAMVTGGSNGIGLAIAKALIEAGAKVAITGRDEKRLTSAAKAIGAHAIRSDVGKEADVLRTYKEFFQKFDHLDILVNNAGFGVLKPLVDMSLADFEKVFATNVTGAMLMGREAAKHFIERKSGNIINIGSTAAVRGAEKGTAYYGSKFALRGMTECWRAELRRYNVRVMLVNPSEVLTDFYATAGLPQNKENPTKLRAEDIAHAVKAALEMNERGFTIELTVFATNPRE